MSEIDWVKVAKLAGEHGVRYRTNASFEAFIRALALPSPQAQPLEEVTEKQSATERALQAAADANGGYINAKIVRIVMAALSAQGAALAVFWGRKLRAAINRADPAEGAPGIPADIMKAATDIAYSAETGVPVGSFPGAVYIARAILAERQRFVADFDGVADAGIDAAVAAERERCIEAARAAGNFGDYRRGELTADFGQPRFDMMNSIISAIAALSPVAAPLQEVGERRVLDDSNLHGWAHQQHDFLRQHAEVFTNELGNEIRLVAWVSEGDPLAVRYILDGPRSHTSQQMTPMEAEQLIAHLRAALGWPAALLSSNAEPAINADLRSREDFHSHPVDQLAFELAFELEEADLDKNDYAMVNREKLKAISRRILARDHPAPPAPGEADVQ
ncbi:hypothetical protein D3227_04715 [Mesorhizobium waimense]|uniref:Uncharacterized protein n=1 Tax=Mesorhizobium waimense TaxID=1300307 RepID=A0A3A5KYN9_9HYPH|nr:hypothetical protein [Mesorhizobium waimense]RJT41985.1 hypothetical protein D3227_04715 [Mesorhizobium waimense]